MYVRWNRSCSLDTVHLRSKSCSSLVGSAYTFWIKDRTFHSIPEGDKESLRPERELSEGPLILKQSAQVLPVIQDPCYPRLLSIAIPMYALVTPGVWWPLNIGLELRVQGRVLRSCISHDGDQRQTCHCSLRSPQRRIDQQGPRSPPIFRICGADGQFIWRKHALG